MNILALETSGRILSVALSTEEHTLESSFDTGFRHSETLMPVVDQLFKDSAINRQSLDLVACSAGPGSFTALRIGMATAKGIVCGTGCALKAVPTLPLLAMGLEHWEGIVMPVMDARKNRVYTAAFQKGKRLVEDRDTPLGEFIDSLPDTVPILATGPDASIAAEFDRVTVDPDCSRGRGTALIQLAKHLFLGEGGDSMDRGLDYLRLSDAQINTPDNKSAGRLREQEITYG